MLGKIFRELRKNKGISIIEASQGITSPSSVQRWENNQGQMSIEKVLQLLNRIEIQPDEFLAKANILDLNLMEKKISKAYQSNNVEQLKELATSLLAASNLHSSNNQIFIHAAIACNYYLDLSNHNLFNEDRKNVLRLRTILLSVKKWDQKDVALFGNTILLLSIYDIQKISNSLLGWLIYQDNPRMFFTMAVNTLINAVVALLKKKAPKMAYDLLVQIKHIHLSKRNINEIVKIQFLCAFFEYLETNDSYIMTNFFQSLSYFGMEEVVADYKLGLSQLEEVYSLGR